MFPVGAIQCYNLMTKRGTNPMNVTLPEAIAIYAKASISWFGEKAAEKTAQKAKALAALGDHEGADVFKKVQAEIARLQHTHRRRQTFMRPASRPPSFPSQRRDATG
jgi:hypothetical protein